MKKLFILTFMTFITTTAVADPGDILWANSYGSIPSTAFNSLDQTLSGGTICAGMEGSQIYVVETDAEGTEIWSVTYGGVLDDEAENVKALSDGCFLICGQTESYATDIEDAFLWKLDASGGLVWQQNYDGPGYTNFTSLEVNDHGDIVCAGYSQSASAGYQGIVAIYSPTGDPLDSAIIGTAMDETFSEIQQTSDGGYIVCGFTNPSGTDEFWLVKLDSDLDVEWTRNYTQTTRARAMCLTVVNTGGYLLGGFVGNYGDADAKLLRLDESGTVIWQQSYGGSYWNSCNDLLALSDGGFAVAGFNSPVNGTWHPWVFVVDADGTLRWETIYDAEAGGTAIRLEQADANDLLVCGQIRLGWNTYALLMKIENGFINCPVESTPMARIALWTHPNPFNPRATVSFDLPSAQQVNLTVLDVLGRRVTTLLDTNLGAGKHSVRWDGLDDAGRGVCSGTYFVALNSAQGRTIRKVALVR